MKEDIVLGRVVGETEAFVDVELDGHDVRNLLTLHAAKCAELLSVEEIELFRNLVEILLRGNLAAKRSIARIHKNLYAAANEKPQDDE